MLVVDDNAENRALAQATLEDEDYRVVLAPSGEAGIAAFEREHPDCVLLDVRMPGMDGVVACQRMRALPGGTDVPILFVTAQRDVDTFDRAKLAGGDDYITKPFRPNELVMRVEAAMKLRRISAERTELYELIRKQRDDVMRLQLQREQLIAFLVHDLKNPVHAIELNAQRVARDPGATERGRSAASQIQSDTRALSRMIGNLLDLSKDDEGALAPKLDRVVLPPLVADIVTAMEVRARASNVTLEVDAPALAAKADADLVRRVIENIVDNAIRHAPEDSSVRISARLVDSRVEIRIADAGAGIPEELRAQVFERFVRGTSGRAGHGLGLAFCKVATAAQGGSIWIEDANPGTIFVVRFDAA
ncbi:MAG: hybrid sensor histidine kinase/response regulator [Kofleriaceae bacterium]|nr:hybrid sensor histidine kinase/response regulator [Kofleriaceae bacterium]